MSTGTGPCEDVSQEIIERISLHKDLLSCTVVYKQWRSIVMDNIHRLPNTLPLSYCLPRQHLLPLLMYFNDDEVVGKIKFLSVSDDKSFAEYSVPEISGKWIAGSSNGCLVLTEILGQKIYVLNPLTRAQISLPALFNVKCTEYVLGCIGYEYDEFALIHKAIVLFEHHSRNLEDCIVIAIASCGRSLSFCRPGDDNWWNIRGCPSRAHDVVYFNGELYAVVYGGVLLSIDVQHQCARIVGGHRWVCCNLRRGYPFGNEYFVVEYLVESASGNLLLVARVTDTLSTIKFLVYMLEEVDETKIVVSADHSYEYGSRAAKYVWTKVDSLDDQILFLGRNSKCVPASLYPGLRGNCIYFTDDDLFYEHVHIARAKAGYKEFIVYRAIKNDAGIYDMAENRIQRIGFMDGKPFRVPPVWVEPNLWLKNN